MKMQIIAIALLAVGGIARAQQDAATRLRPITSPIRNAGTYHLATRTWTRATSQANLVGTNIIYNNTCPTGFYAPLSGDHYIDEGRIPGNSPNEPNNLHQKPGCASSYTIDGFQIGYCTDQPAAMFGTYTVDFFQHYAPCTSVVGLTPTASFAMVGLPGTAVAGTLRCWTVNIDLDSPPQSASLAFDMLADGTGTYVPPLYSDMFGWSMQSSLSPAASQGTGPMLAGDFNVCTGYDGTRWDPVVNYAEPGTGMDTLCEIYIEGGPSTAPGCYVFQCPWVPASFHLQLFSSSACITNEPGAPFCFGDAAPGFAPCPCNNNSASGDEVGCLNSFGIGGKLRASGVASVSNDTLTLLGSQMTPTSTCLYFQGTIQQSGGAGSQFGDGLRCAGGSVTRLGVRLNAAGASQYPSTGDPSVSVQGAVGANQVRTYQVWYRNIADFCTIRTFNLTNGYHIVWQP